MSRTPSSADQAQPHQEGPGAALRDLAGGDRPTGGAGHLGVDVAVHDVVCRRSPPPASAPRRPRSEASSRRSGRRPCRASASATPCQPGSISSQIPAGRSKRPSFSQGRSGRRRDSGPPSCPAFASGRPASGRLAPEAADRGRESFCRSLLSRAWHGSSASLLTRAAPRLRSHSRHSAPYSRAPQSAHIRRFEPPLPDPRMQTRNPFFDEAAKDHGEAPWAWPRPPARRRRPPLRAQGDRMAAELDLVRRDELDADARGAGSAEIAALRAEIARLLRSSRAARFA